MTDIINEFEQFFNGKQSVTMHTIQIWIYVHCTCTMYSTCTSMYILLACWDVVATPAVERKHFTELFLLRYIQPSHCLYLLAQQFYSIASGIILVTLQRPRTIYKIYVHNTYVVRQKWIGQRETISLYPCHRSNKFIINLKTKLRSLVHSKSCMMRFNIYEFLSFQ